MGRVGRCVSVALASFCGAAGCGSGAGDDVAGQGAISGTQDASMSSSVDSSGSAVPVTDAGPGRVVTAAPEASTLGSANNPPEAGTPATTSPPVMLNTVPEAGTETRFPAFPSDAGSDVAVDAFEAFCSGSGPVVNVSNRGGTPGTHATCTGRIAETRFMNALCTCENATVAGYLRTRGFDSRRSPSSGETSDGGGSVGINNSYTITIGYTDIGGSLSLAGAESLSFAGYLKTVSDLRIAGDAIVAGYTSVGRNAWFGGDFTDLGRLEVRGDLHSAGAVTAMPLAVGGAQVGESITVAKPCPCEPDDLLDIDSLVKEAKIHNDNSTAGIDARMFDSVVGNVQVTLPCGRFYVERISGLGTIVVNVTGRVALFIDGSFEAAGRIEFRLAPAGEIDIFVRENLVLAGIAIFGATDRPAASRIYVGGDGDVLVAGAAGFVGNIYAPRSLVAAIGYAEIWGSVFAKNFLSPGYANFVYDNAIQHAGDTCDVPAPPPGTCSLCGTCTGGSACVDGVCGACRTDADCCSPWICSQGTCAELPPPVR